MLICFIMILLTIRVKEYQPKKHFLSNIFRMGKNYRESLLTTRILRGIGPKHKVSFYPNILMKPVKAKQ